jgi:phospholipid/cholesterol/gamma-HCH transport system substrate-binding protein
MKLRNEAMVGVVVVLGLITVAVGSIWLSGRPFAQEQRELVAVFREVGELVGGNPVKYRGVEVGRVTRVELSSRGDGAIVTMRVDPDIILPADVGVVLAPASLFGEWQAQIASRRNWPDLDFATIPGREAIPGAALPDISQLTAVAARIAAEFEVLTERVTVAFTEETAVKIRQTIENVQEMSDQLTGFVDQQTVAYRDVSRNVLGATENIQGATATVERVAGQVEMAVTEGEIQATLANVRQASDNLRLFSERLDQAVEGVPALMARADTSLVTMGRTADEFGALARDLRPQLQEVGPLLQDTRGVMQEAQGAIATLQRALARIEEGDGTLGRLLEDPALYEETQAAVATLRRIMADIQAEPARYLQHLRIRVF